LEVKKKNMTVASLLEFDSVKKAFTDQPVTENEDEDMIMEADDD
jgi:hypothetical protein